MKSARKSELRWIQGPVITDGRAADCAGGCLGCVCACCVGLCSGVQPAQRFLLLTSVSLMFLANEIAYEQTWNLCYV